MTAENPSVVLPRTAPAAGNTLELVGLLELVCEEVASIIDGVAADDWRRTGTVDGEARTAVSLAREAVHTGSHHLRAVQRVLRQVSP